MKNLKRLREEKGVSQQKVADAIGTNQQSIHRYENGDYEPDIQTMFKLADYFETSIDYIVGRTDIRRKIEPVEDFALSRDEAELISEVRGLTLEYRRCLASMVDALVKVADTSPASAVMNLPEAKSQ